jgi:alpha-aminoadipic semialdehyde synthase
LRLHFPQVPISNVLRLEGIANRDSWPHAESYQLGDMKDLRTLLRGTLRQVKLGFLFLFDAGIDYCPNRYPGFSELMHSFKCLGLLETAAHVAPSRWGSLARLSMEVRLGTTIQEDAGSVRSAAGDLIHSSKLDSLFHTLDWLTSGSLPMLPSRPAAPIDLFSALLAHKLRYEPNERDMVMLHHEIVVQPGSSDPSNLALEEVHTSSLTAYGTAVGSAMSRCVGLPVAFAALRVLDGGVNMRGVSGPTDESLYASVLSGLQEVGLGMKETVARGAGVEGTLAAGLASHQL